MRSDGFLSKLAVCVCLLPFAGFANGSNTQVQTVSETVEVEYSIPVNLSRQNCFIYMESGATDGEYVVRCQISLGAKIPNQGRLLPSVNNQVGKEGDLSSFYRGGAPYQSPQVTLSDDRQTLYLDYQGELNVDGPDRMNQDSFLNSVITAANAVSSEIEFSYLGPKFDYRPLTTGSSQIRDIQMVSLDYAIPVLIDAAHCSLLPTEGASRRVSVTCSYSLGGTLHRAGVKVFKTGFKDSSFEFEIENGSNPTPKVHFIGDRIEMEFVLTDYKSDDANISLTAQKLMDEIQREYKKNPATYSFTYVGPAIEGFDSGQVGRSAKTGCVRAMDAS